MKDFSNFEENYKILSNIKNPYDVKKLSYKELVLLCKEIRKKIVYTVSQNGGHLASSLGVVELTVALHKEFNSPYDKIIWDTGHQGYAHKLLTGRFDRFNSLRKKNGIAAFMDPLESEHDAFISGHSSVSLSAACGIAKSELLKKSNNMVLAVVGDGALTGGICYEALNNAIDMENLIIILNCNDMSISKTVGRFSKYLNNIRYNETYISMNIMFRNFLEKIPLIGKFAKKTLHSSKEVMKKIVYKNNIFNELGFSFLNFVDGHSLKELFKAFRWAKKIKKPAIVQVFTKKGKGYLNSEKEPELYHGVGPFNIKDGVLKTNVINFSSVFGDELNSLAKKDEKICAITAAMGTSTGLLKFKENFPERYFDVGIAEEHAVIFAAGLSVGGMTPVFAIYSTFLQRSYDQLIHDVAISNTHVVLAIDRAGVVEDGKTHQGIFDVAFLTTIPNVKIYSPATYKELKDMLKIAIYDETGLVAVRYPKGEELENFDDMTIYKDYLIFGEFEIAVVTYGILFKEVLKLKEQLKTENINITIIKINKIFPISEELVQRLKSFKEIFFFEEGIKNGGIAEHLFVKLFSLEYSGLFYIRAIETFVSQSTVEEAWEDLKLTSKFMKEEIFKKSSILKKKHEINIF